jgi:hypothetical protein
MKTRENTGKKGKIPYGADGLPTESTNPILGRMYSQFILAYETQEST